VRLKMALNGRLGACVFQSVHIPTGAFWALRYSMWGIRALHSGVQT
jgi:hypothetical protein